MDSMQPSGEQEHQVPDCQYERWESFLVSVSLLHVSILLAVSMASVSAILLLVWEAAVGTCAHTGISHETAYNVFWQ